MRRLAVLLLPLALVLAACGGSSALSKHAYEQRIQADGKSVQVAINAVSKNTTSLATLAKQVDTAEAAVKKAADDLDSLTPPKDAAADNDAIVTGLRTIAGALDSLKKAAKKGDAAGARAAAASVSNARAVTLAQKAANDLKKKGYSIGVIGS